MTTQTSGTAVTDTDADRALKAKHAAMWALGDYPAVATEIIAALGPGPRRGRRHRGRPARARRRRRLRQRRHPGRRAPARDVDRQRPDARAARAGPRATPRRAGSTLDVAGRPTPRHCRSTTASSTPSSSCVGVMFAPHHQAGRRRAGPRLPPRRHDRPDQLDAGGLHRADVRDHEAVRPAAAARRAAAAAVGRRRPRARAVRRPGRPTSRRASRTLARGRVRRRRRSSASSSRPTTARPSPSTRPSPTTPTRSPRWTGTSSTLAERFDRGDGHTVLDWEYLLVTARRG